MRRRFISFSRGSNERACLFPVLKTLLGLGEREMRVGEMEGDDVQIVRGDMSYRPASRIPIEKWEVRRGSEE